MKRSTSWQTRYPGFGWSIRPDRTTRTVTAVAVAELVGTMVGGFSAFGVFSALTPPPREDAAAAASATPIRTIYGAVPDPSAGMTAGAPVQTPAAAPAQQPQIALPPPQQPMTSAQGQSTAQGQSIATPPQQQQPAAVAATIAPQVPAQPPQPARAQTAPAVQGPQKTWPDALSHARSGPGETTEAAAPAAQSAPAASKDDAAKDAAAKNDDDRAAMTSAPAEPQRRPYTRKRVVNSRKPQPAVDANAGDTPRRNGRPVYDYFWGHAPRAEQDDDADSGGTALSGMKPPRTGRATRNEVTKSRYVHGRRAPADTDDAQDAPHEERDRGGGKFFGRGHWHEDDDDD